MLCLEKMNHRQRTGETKKKRPPEAPLCRSSLQLSVEQEQRDHGVIFWKENYPITAKNIKESEM